ncbi:MAG: endonuclease/exonuclease/phosphatase family protein [Desulfobacteraceae bacterium]
MVTSDGKNRTIRLFCLNLRFGLADDGANGWAYRKQCYPDLLDGHPCDFYGFQEANDFQVSHLQRLLPEYGLIGQRRPAPDFWQNNVIFHHKRWKCLTKVHFYLSPTPDKPSKYPQSQWPRQCTMGLFQNDAISIAVVNTHFDFKADVQRKSAMLILERLDRMAPNNPAVLMGDLNAGPDADCVAVLTSGDGGFESALPPSSGGTYHGFSGLADGPPIDWILFRGDLKKEDATVVTEQYAGRFPSDHFPLIATFRLKI